MPYRPRPKSLHCLHNPASRPPYPTSIPMRIKTLLQHHVFPYMFHVAEALAKLRSAVSELLKKKNADPYSFKISRRRRKRQQQQQQLFPTIQMHYSWSSSHVLPVPELPSSEGIDPAHLYYDSTWNSVINASGEGNYGVEQQLSGYLHWVEERQQEVSMVDQDDVDEINRLAEKFIASCHEKFRLEKQESYRRYQEMLARSI
ncbi:hypothetical protein Taro_044886 [Colocasia esculenta]|uniref:DUF761 domain-containing protein n=1 Tax=Colocasia esculenta TaxID=4460 RepID=A0A843X3Y4_COLES|nr:hypothetical protein [Colocasia esculenta]